MDDKRLAIAAVIIGAVALIVCGIGVWYALANGISR